MAHRVPTPGEHHYRPVPTGVSGDYFSVVVARVGNDRPDYSSEPRRRCHWTAASTLTSGGAPVALNALGPSRALLTMQHESPNEITTWLMVTVDAGRNWHRLALQ